MDKVHHFIYIILHYTSEKDKNDGPWPCCSSEATPIFQSSDCQKCVGETLFFLPVTRIKVVITWNMIFLITYISIDFFFLPSFFQLCNYRHGFYYFSDRLASIINLILSAMKKIWLLWMKLIHDKIFYRFYQPIFVVCNKLFNIFLCFLAYLVVIIFV